jgi:glutamate dehydrogenase/leucine dehydrogenase
MNVIREMEHSGHEQMVFVTDAPTGLRAIIAVHSTALGPSLGGIRFWHYPDDDAAVHDALRLSEAMTHKAAVAGLHQGGGKAVVLWGDPLEERKPGLLHALGRAVDELGGRYIAAEDVGATTHDMDSMAEVTPWVTGVSTPGGSGDPSPVTAFGVFCAMWAASEHRWGEGSLRGKRVVVQGAGKVGAELARLLVAKGAIVQISDVDSVRVKALVDELDINPLPVDSVLQTPCDILAPCALGDVVTMEVVEQLRCEIICGGANNQLATDDVDAALADREVLYVPDFVANAGGIINIAQEFTGYSRDQAMSEASRIQTTTAKVLATARAWDLPPAAAAVRMARERIRVDASPSGRWEPGDPAAWTNGAPLTKVRP